MLAELVLVGQTPGLRPGLRGSPGPAPSLDETRLSKPLQPDVSNAGARSRGARPWRAASRLVSDASPIHLQNSHEKRALPLGRICRIEEEPARAIPILAKTPWQTRLTSPSTSF